MERLAYRIIVRAYRECISKVVDGINEYGAAQTLHSLDGIFPQTAIKNAYEVLYTQVGVKQKEWADQDIKARFPRKKEEDKLPQRPRTTFPFEPLPKPVLEPSFSLSFFNPAWLARLKTIVNGLDVAQRVASVSDTLKKQIKKSLEESTQLFVSPRKIIAKLRRDTGGEFTVRRAEAIVRTEVTHIANIAAEQSAKEIGIDLVKFWISTNDDRRRESHRNVTKKAIKSHEKFLVGGKRMDKPGDPAGGIKEIIECRCIVAYAPADDYEDLEL